MFIYLCIYINIYSHSRSPSRPPPFCYMLDDIHILVDGLTLLSRSSRNS